jgi:hypothetical protein
MKRIRNFVIHTFKDVPKEQRQEIVERVTQSLIEKVEDLMEKGYTLDQAVDKTVLEFGDANDYFLPIDKPRTLIQHVKSIREYRNDLLFSIFGALIIIGMLVFTNLQYTSGIIWFVLPSLAVLWWPLAVLYRFLNKKEGDKKE